jgi:hypothetical protein
MDFEAEKLCHAFPQPVHDDGEDTAEKAGRGGRFLAYNSQHIAQPGRTPMFDRR